MEGQVQEEKEEVMNKKCPICKKEVAGYSNKKTCSPACKKKLLTINRIRKQNEELCSLFG